MARKATKYQRAVEWIAWNDEPQDHDEITVSEMISVSCIADVFEKTAMTVAMDVIAYRDKNDV